MVPPVEILDALVDKLVEVDKVDEVDKVVVMVSGLTIPVVEVVAVFKKVSVKIWFYYVLSYAEVCNFGHGQLYHFLLLH